ncbi:MAG: ATPase/protein kinase [Bacteroidetes bacterium RIFOXYA12_FULL_35_11]|nr:MAG: ATPase/protein kinase [Bacteroidetes bacterium GWF2_35_48]OFY74490.1 MAG: ATPase/protein kinase [Bacteroidetes bacterium RIFOXYA12_FULL_35_11]OFY94695.1 MAG: ATPase/protein kinase [Bacteroidetes bacterium RIFOXYC12_FULL_35_7]HBX50295.1 methylmalonyl Co-A mutase-associated GTPase MeaB [Bacteroidales bacterium]
MEHIENDEIYKGLSVSKGIPQPPPVSEDAIEAFKKKKRKQYTASEFIQGILVGNRIVLSQAITLVESALTEHQLIAQEVIEKCLPYSGNSIRIGITGVPGVGKSSFIETLGTQITGSGRKLAVLAIDPSSERSKGSILGDKTRMEELSIDKNAYIRPSPSSGSLGGVARKTRESMILCEAAGFDTIFIETVGVGQSETAVHSMVDFFLLLMLAGAGDELQGIKRGIMEMADAIVITKADGTNHTKTKLAQTQYQSALHLFPLSKSRWTPRVLTCSALNKTGIIEIWEMILEYIQATKTNNFFDNKRFDQAAYWMHETIAETLKNNFYSNTEIKKQINDIEKQVCANNLTSFVAAKMLLDSYFRKNNI